MDSDREELYIINGDTGQTLFYHSFSPMDHDPELFGGLLAAILQFAKSYSKYQIGGFSMAKNEISIFRSRKNPLVYVYIVDKKLLKKKSKYRLIEKKLTEISNEFEQIFSHEQICEWNGDVMLFKGFESYMSSISKTGSKFWLGF